MKIEELLKFNGKNIMEYQKAIEQRDKARRSIKKLMSLKKIEKYIKDNQL